MRHPLYPSRSGRSRVTNRERSRGADTEEASTNAKFAQGDAMQSMLEERSSRGAAGEGTRAETLPGGLHAPSPGKG